MPFEKVEKIWMNGKLVNWDDAKIHVLSHVIHYGSSLFEGERCYKTKKGPAIFRLQAHTDRLFNSCKIYRMKIPYTKEEINQAIIDLIKINKLDECYIRPVVYRGYEQLGVDPTGCPIDVCIAVWRWGKYLGPEALEKGVPVCVSSWNRMAPNTMPDMAKSGANYMNAQLIKLEAKEHGYVEGIALDVYGFVSEGSGENVFIVRDGALITPSFSSSILPGIVRNTVMTLAHEMGIKVIEESIPREALYIADEVFFTGSAAEITPISSIDKIPVGTGTRGPIAKKLQDRFFEIVSGQGEDKYGWLTYVK
ncbi:MAG: branched-chain amino acid aminotransferase [candidate division Zixibacteria bacterium SM23_73]|nr:MAG: branched-chain amino acid aminotransferase [candidate division Zixibacteria bacterium SM23_73]